MELSIQEIITRLVLATLLSGLIGLEREVRQKPAGVRTNALIGLGSAVVTLCGLYVAKNSAVADPGRMASIVIQGVGFLGAGAIIQASGSVRGLTTAATMWVVAGIGIATGLGYYLVSLTAGFIVFVLLAVLGPLDAKLMGDESEREITGWFKKKNKKN